MTGAIFVPVTYLHFVLALLDELPRRKRFLIFSYLVFSIFFLLDFTPLFVTGVQPELSFPFWPKPGIAYHFFLAVWFFYMLYCIWLLYAGYRKSELVRKTQIKYVLLGIGFALLGASTNFFLWYGIPIPPIGNILVLAYIGSTAYAILKYQLMQVRVVATEVFAVLIPIVLLVDSLFSENKMETIWKSIIFILVSFFSFLIIQGVLKEIK